jgi:exopolyphosphatase/guanosine-5'-triphosphate,3'-diphosphate pyrophosphatase
LNTNNSIPPLCRAVIDVGTNSVKLLVAKVSGRQVAPVWEESEQTRLGGGFYQTGRLQPQAIRQTAEAVAEFAQLAARWQPVSIRVIATSAARDAVNQGDLLLAIQRASGLTVEVISGEQEAEWVFHGVSTDPGLANQPLLILDVGGGSTEFIVGDGTRLTFRRSFPIGTVRLLERLAPADPPGAGELERCRTWLAEYLNREVRPHLGRELERFATDTLQLVGTGGTTTILTRIQKCMTTFDREQIEATRLSREQVRQQLERLWALSLAERREIIGLPPKRADVILFGAAIFEAVMEQFGLDPLRTSTRGLRFGAMIE